MTSLIKILLSACVFYVSFWHIQGLVQTHFSEDYFDGIFIYFPVRRSMLQTRLDEINSQSADNDVKFFLPPEGTVFPEILTRDQHVVMVVYGNVIANSFEKSMTSAQKESFSTRSDTLNFDIPVVSSSPGGLPQFTLLMARYTSAKTEVIDPNFAITSKIPADELNYTSDPSHFSISFTHGKNLSLKMSGEVSASCRRPADTVITDFTTYLDELHISQQPPDFSICDRLGDIDVDYCNAWRSYGEEIARSGSNVCQFWTHSRNVTTCQASVNVSEMSDEIRDMLALPHGEEPHAIQVETMKGYFGIGLVSPCV